MWCLRLIAGSAVIVGVGITATADVTVSRTVEVSVFGAPPIETSITEYIQGDKSCSEIVSQVADDSDMPGAGLPPEVIVVRLDRQSIIMIDPDMKTYDEVPLDMFAEMKRMMEAEWAAYRVDPMVWSTSIDSNLNAQVGEYQCSGFRAVATGFNREDSVKTVIVSYEVWVTDQLAVPEELTSVRARLRNMIGMNLDPQSMAIEDMVSQYFPDIEELSGQAMKLTGFPIRTAVTVDVLDSSGPDPDDPSIDPSIYREAVEMMKYLSRQMGKEPPEGMFTVFSLTSNFTDMSINPIDPSLFEVPDGYEKIAE